MNMIFLDIEFNDFPMFPLCDGFEGSSQLIFDFLWTEYLSSVLRGKDEVVFHLVVAV